MFGSRSNFRAPHLLLAGTLGSDPTSYSTRPAEDRELESHGLRHHLFSKQRPHLAILSSSSGERRSRPPSLAAPLGFKSKALPERFTLRAEDGGPDPQAAFAARTAFQAVSAPGRFIFPEGLSPLPPNMVSKGPEHHLWG